MMVIVKKTRIESLNKYVITVQDRNFQASLSTDNIWDEISVHFRKGESRVGTTARTVSPITVASNFNFESIGQNAL